MRAAWRGTVTKPSVWFLIGKKIRNIFNVTWIVVKEKFIKKSFPVGLFPQYGENLCTSESIGRVIVHGSAVLAVMPIIPTQQ
jgi:hypothetical protein